MSLLKTAAFIDGANLHSTARALNYSVDFKRLLVWMNEKYNLVRPYYYSGVKDTVEDNSIIKLLDYLEYNGYNMKTKTVREYRNADGQVRFKADMDVDITIDVVKICRHVDHILFISGDGDLVPVVEYVQSMAIKVTVISTIETKPAMINDDLRRQCDDFIDLTLLKEICLKPFADSPKFGTVSR